MTHPSEGLLASDADRDAAASALADAAAARDLSGRFVPPDPGVSTLAGPA
jgi:hypothetical protein